MTTTQPQGIPIRKGRTGIALSAVLTIIMSVMLLIAVIFVGVEASRLSDLNAKAKELTADSLALNSQIKESQADRQKVESDRDILAAQLESAQDELIQTQAKLAEESKQVADKSRVPFSVTYRNALVGPGYVASFTNRSDRALTALATYEKPTTKQKVTQTMILKAGQTLAVGYAQGWTFTSGDVITLTSAGYENLVIKIR